MIRLSKLNPAKAREVLDYLQVTCLPYDDPAEYKPNDHWLVAKDGGLPIAFGCIRPTALNPNVWYMARAGVLPQRRGLGLQKRIIKARLAIAIKAKAHYVVTDTTTDNVESANSLIRCGFKLMRPHTKWALPNSIYWRFSICSDSD